MAEMQRRFRRPARAELLEVDQATLSRGTAALDQAQPLAMPAGSGAETAATAGGIGLGAGFVGGPLVGLGFGALAGILGTIDNKRKAKHMMDWQNSINDLDEKARHALAGVVNNPDATEGDKANATEQYRVQSEFLQQVQELGPQQGRQMLATVSEKDRQRQADIDREAITRMRDSTMQNRTKLQDTARAMFRDHLETSQAAGQLHTLLADPEVDIDSPYVQAELAKLIDQTKRNLLANPEDMTDAMRGIGGTGVLGGVAALASLFFGAQKAEDMRFSREEWRTIAAANEAASLKRQQRERAALSGEAQAHIKASDGLGLQTDEFTAMLAKLQGLDEEAEQLRGRGGYPRGVEPPTRRSLMERMTNDTPAEGSEPAAGAPPGWYQLRRMFTER